jgi:hypothetical protein
MELLTIGFSKPKSKFALFATAIKWFEQTEYSHCYIKFTTSSGVPLICQASKGMLNFMSPAAFNLHNIIVKEYEIVVSIEQLTQIKTSSMEKAGLPYSIKQVFGIVLARIFKLNKNPLDISEDTFVCSEWVGQVLESIGADLDKDLSLLTPRDIYQYLEVHHDKQS